VSSDEYLNYAKKNREEWEARGQEVVAEMIEEVTKKLETEAVDAESKNTDKNDEKEFFA
jgi:hypothetical protein